MQQSGMAANCNLPQHNHTDRAAVQCPSLPGIVHIDTHSCPAAATALITLLPCMLIYSVHSNHSSAQSASNTQQYRSTRPPIHGRHAVLVHTAHPATTLPIPPPSVPKPNAPTACVNGQNCSIIQLMATGHCAACMRTCRSTCGLSPYGCHWHSIQVTPTRCKMCPCTLRQHLLIAPWYV